MEVNGVPKEYLLSDWRRRVNDIYAAVRQAEDPEVGWRYWHEARSALFKTHPMSPIDTENRRDFSKIAVFPYDLKLRFEVALNAVPRITTTTGLGVDGDLVITAFARTSGLGRRLGDELTVYWINGYGGGLFIPFGDASNGGQTYGGGRYIMDGIKGADLGRGASGGLILDFNFAFNPSCALNDDYVCPLSPPENKLKCGVLGGEKASDH